MPSAPKQHGITTNAAKHVASKPSRARADAHRGSARERGYTREWDAFSLSFLEAHPLCEYCLPAGRIEPATVTDHDIPHRGDMHLFWDNTFTALCAPCHNRVKARLEARHSGDALLDAIARLKGGGGCALPTAK